MVSAPLLMALAMLSLLVSTARIVFFVGPHAQSDVAIAGATISSASDCVSVDVDGDLSASTRPCAVSLRSDMATPSGLGDEAGAQQPAAPQEKQDGGDDDSLASHGPVVTMLVNSCAASAILLYDYFRCGLNYSCFQEAVDRLPCLCAAKSTGGRCQTNIDDCVSSPCPHGPNNICCDRVDEFDRDYEFIFSGSPCDFDTVMSWFVSSIWNYIFAILSVFLIGECWSALLRRCAVVRERSGVNV